MALFSTAGGTAVQLMPIPSHPGKEKGLQTLIEASLDALFGVRFVATEFATGQKHRGRIDTLGLDEDGSPVIIEYKLRSNENVINQGLFYLDWLMDHRGDFELAARGALGDDANVSWVAPRLILLAGSFSRYDQYAVNRINDQIELWTYKLYEGDLMLVEQLGSEEIPSPTGQPTKPPSVPRKPQQAAARPSHDLDHHLGKMSPKTQPLFEALREHLIDLGDDVTERFMAQYIGYRRRKNFCQIVGQRGKLNVLVDGPVSDPDGIGEDVSNIGRWGTGELRFSVGSEDDVAAVLPIIEEAYHLQA